MSEGWRFEDVTGSAAEIHAREPVVGEGRGAWWCHVDEPAIVLGSAQPESTVDLDACRRAGIAVVRRRSGGGAVLLVPGEVLWLDVVIPQGDPLWSDDVGRAMWWFGEAWARALRSFGVQSRVHRGGLQRSPWSAVVCFDGLGAGEVVVGAGAKAVGISQRRTRHWTRLQSTLHLRWRPDVLVDLLAAPRPAAGELQPVWTSPIAPGDMRAAVEHEVRIAGP